MHNVCGYAEGSPDTHALINKVAEAGVIKHLQALSCPTLKQSRVAVRNKLYVAMGVSSIRGLALLRLERLTQVIAGSASGNAARERRARAQAEWRAFNQSYQDRHAYDNRNPGSQDWW